MDTHLLVTKQILVGIFILLITLVSVTYYGLNYEERIHDTAEKSRCVTELTSARFQLEAAMSSKNKIDKLFTETEKQYDLEKTRFNKIMEGCLTVKEQVLYHQNQYQRLQNECDKIKEEYYQFQDDNIEKTKQDD